MVPSRPKEAQGREHPSLILSKNPAATHVPPGGAGQQLCSQELGRQSQIVGCGPGAEEEEESRGKKVGTVALPGLFRQGPGDWMARSYNSSREYPLTTCWVLGVLAHNALGGRHRFPFACGIPAQRLSNLYKGWKAVKRRFELCLPDSQAQIFTMQHDILRPSWSENRLARHPQVKDPLSQHISKP